MNDYSDVISRYHMLQQAYHAHSDITDYLDDIAEHTPIRYVHMVDDELVCDVVDYLTNECSDLTYPTKSFAVAIVYSTMIELYFGVPKLEALRDAQLLFNNDPCYTPYDDCRDLYDRIFHELSFDNIDVITSMLPQLVSTRSYFKSEFMIGSDLHLHLFPEFVGSPLVK